MKKTILSLFLGITLTVSISVLYTHAQTATIPSPCASVNPGDKIGQCGDSKDNQVDDGKDHGLGLNKGDGKADYCGVDTNKDGKLDLEPDPACVSQTDPIEEADDVAEGSLIPCTNKCTLSDVFRLINGLLTFFIKILLIPIFIILVMYAGFKYITAEGNPAKTADLKKMFGNMVKGILLVLCSWLIVNTILTMIGYTDGLLFFGN